MSALRPTLSPAEIETRVRDLGPWFHNLDLAGVPTAPDHFLGDYPRAKWKRFENAIPRDLTGRTVLDVGCNGGFYSIEMKRRGAARVLGIDSDEGYLAQARFAAEVMGADIELRRMSVYDVAQLGERFDLVLFLGVLYHLRHPLLALDLLHEHVVKDRMVFQAVLRGADVVEHVPENFPFWDLDRFHDAGFPKLHFIERRFASDETNWWVPNRACAEAMLRSSGFAIESRPEAEVYMCRRIDGGHPPPQSGAV